MGREGEGKGRDGEGRDGKGKGGKGEGVRVQSPYSILRGRGGGRGKGFVCNHHIPY